MTESIASDTYDLLKPKEVIFHDSVLNDIRDYPKNVRKKIGDLLYDLQNGKQIGPPDSKPMPGVKDGVFELRLKGQDNIYRVFYYLRIKNTILVFHSFIKKSQKTPSKEIKNGVNRLNYLLRQIDGH